MLVQIGRVKQGPQTDFDAKTAMGTATELRVLLAEDTPINAEAMKAMAEHLSVEMDAAANGLDAIEMVQSAEAERRPYSLLLIDVMMPILDGIETTKRLRSLGFDEHRLPIVAVTAATSFDEIRTYRASGMQAFLAKPVALADLRATFEAWGHAGQQVKALRHANIAPALMKTLTQQFQKRNRDTLELIEKALSVKGVPEGDIETIRNLLHQIAGTAATFGDAELSEVARAQENALIEAQTAGEDVRPALALAALCLAERVGP